MTDAAQIAVCAVPRGAGEEALAQAVRETALQAGLDWLKPGDSVFIKLCGNSANPYPATTSPLAVKAMTALLKEHGAGRVLAGDKPGVESVHHTAEGRRGSSREVMGKNGLHGAILEAGAEPHYFDEAGYDAYFDAKTANPGHWRGLMLLPKVLQEVDHVVLLPRVSRHVLAGATLGLKAAVGWLRDDSRMELHRDAGSFPEKAAEINDALVLREKLRLTLSVADKVQTTFGPDKGHQAQPDPGLVLASRSLLAHDMLALAWLLWCREHATPPEALAWFRDPYQSWPALFNRVFVGIIWGWEAFRQGEGYRAPAITGPRSDRILSRAADMWGGFPELELLETGGRLPEELRRYLLETAGK